MNLLCCLLFFVQCHFTSLVPQPAAAALYPCRPSQPDRLGRSRQRSEKTEGKIKERGTVVRVKPCLHVGWRGTRFVWPCAVCGTKSAPALIEWRALSAGLGSATLEFMP